MPHFINRSCPRNEIVVVGNQLVISDSFSFILAFMCACVADRAEFELGKQGLES